MKIAHTKTDDVLVATIEESRLDASIAIDYKKKMLKYIENGENNIVLDLSRVDFIDSSGLGAIVSALKALGREGRMVISGTDENVKTMFRLTRMDKVFEIFETQDEAVKALRQ